jgi:hypothetical protein
VFIEFSFILLTSISTELHQDDEHEETKPCQPWRLCHNAPLFRRFHGWLNKPTTTKYHTRPDGANPIMIHPRRAIFPLPKLRASKFASCSAADSFRSGPYEGGKYQRGAAREMSRFQEETKRGVTNRESNPITTNL